MSNSRESSTPSQFHGLSDAEAMSLLANVKPDSAPGITTDMGQPIGSVIRTVLSAPDQVIPVHLQPTESEREGRIL
jgi:hypothetical protein